MRIKKNAARSLAIFLAASQCIGRPWHTPAHGRVRRQRSGRTAMTMEATSRADGLRIRRTDAGITWTRTAS